jgi:hypothetical protein
LKLQSPKEEQRSFIPPKKMIRETAGEHKPRKNGRKDVV